MKTAIAFLLLILSLPKLHAQVPGAAKSETARTNAPPRREPAAVVSPEVHHDRTVTFRLRAPDAKDVKVAGEWPGGPISMKDDTNGIWSATLGPLEPDIYGYNLTVDGLAMVDPANPWVKPMRAARTSVVEIPGEPPRLWEFQSVPHGTVHEHAYFSKSLGVKRRLHVYTPPGYEKRPKSLPVLYLFHGSGDNDATWTSTGHAHFIADNLFAQHKARPMIIVMTDGHAFSGNPTQVSTNLISRNVEAFGEDLIKDVIPLIESTYRVKANRENRAIIGLSMGGGQSLAIGLKHRELFAWVGGMSSYLPNAEKIITEVFPNSKSNLKLLWIACGKDDRLIDNARQLSAALKQKNIPHEFKETPGNHSWPVWRRYLGEFMPLLFSPTKGGQGRVHTIRNGSDSAGGFSINKNRGDALFEGLQVTNLLAHDSRIQP
ncbi:MAG: alpha/beta hydrolase-fold protein [Verrucomicrobiota bacterium]